MEITPLTHYTAPRYPTHDVLHDHPELLRMVPQRWQHYPAVLTAFGMVSLMLLGASAQEKPGGTLPGAPKDQRLFGKAAPLFVHGEGRGAIGCVSVSPPVFLSEEEARQVIIEEAKLHGITFTKDVRTIPDFLPPGLANLYDIIFPKVMQTNQDSQPLKLENGDPPGNACTETREPLVLDGTDSKRHISFEYISQDDYDQWGEALSREIPDFSTVQSFDFQTAALSLRARLDAIAEPGDIYAVFYDPVATRKIDYDNIIDSSILDIDTKGRKVIQPPMREAAVSVAVFRKLGAKVQANPGEEEVTIRRKNATFHFAYGEVTLNGKPVKLPYPMFLRDQYPYVPLRTVAKLLGYSVKWDGKSHTVTIQEPGKPPLHGSLDPAAVEKIGKDRIPLAFTQQVDTPREVAREQLRAQVRDFLTWLKEEGVI